MGKNKKNRRQRQAAGAKAAAVKSGQLVSTADDDCAAAVPSPHAFAKNNMHTGGGGGKRKNGYNGHNNRSFKGNNNISCEDLSPYDSQLVNWKRLAKIDFWVAEKLNVVSNSTISASKNNNTPAYRFSSITDSTLQVVCHVTRVFIDDRSLLYRSFVPESRRRSSNADESDDEAEQFAGETAGVELDDVKPTDENNNNCRDRRLVNPMLADEPIIPFEGEFADDARLLRSMGLPLGFLNSPFDLDNRKKLYFPAFSKLSLDGCGMQKRNKKQPEIVFEAPMPGPWRPVVSNKPAATQQLQHSIYGSGSKAAAAGSSLATKLDMDQLYNCIMAADSSSDDDDDDDSDSCSKVESFASSNTTFEVDDIFTKAAEPPGMPQRLVFVNSNAHNINNNDADEEEADTDDNSPLQIDEGGEDAEKQQQQLNDSAKSAETDDDVVVNDPNSVWFIDDKTATSTAEADSLASTCSDEDDYDDDDDDDLDDLLLNSSALSLAAAMSNIITGGDGEAAAQFQNVDGGRVSFGEPVAAAAPTTNKKVLVEEMDDDTSVSQLNNSTLQQNHHAKLVTAATEKKDETKNIVKVTADDAATEIVPRTTFRMPPSAVKSKVNEFLTLSNSNNDNHGVSVVDSTPLTTTSLMMPVKNSNENDDGDDPLNKLRFSANRTNSTANSNKRPRNDSDADENFSAATSNGLICVISEEAVSSSNRASKPVKFVPDRQTKPEPPPPLELLDFTADARVYAQASAERQLQVSLSHKGLGLPHRQGLVKLLHTFGLSCSYQPDDDLLSTTKIAVDADSDNNGSTMQTPQRSSLVVSRFGSSAVATTTPTTLSSLVVCSNSTGKTGCSEKKNSFAGIQRYTLSVRNERSGERFDGEHAGGGKLSHRKRKKYLDFGRPHWETQNELFSSTTTTTTATATISNTGENFMVDLDAPPMSLHDADNSSSVTKYSGSTTYKVARKIRGIDAAMPSELLQNESEKYWNQRYRLFSRFDKGIMVAPDSWCGITPERIAEHLALRCQCDTIVDAFGGCGSSTIQFAFTCQHVIYIEIDPLKVAYAKHNAELYGIADRIEFINADFFTVAPTLKADAVFLSPPWGGPAYQEQRTIRLKELGLDGVKVFEAARKISKNIAYFLPRNIDVEQLVELAKYCPDGDAVVNANGKHARELLLDGQQEAVPSVCHQLELEQQFLNSKLKTITAYFGAFVDDETFL